MIKHNRIAPLCTPVRYGAITALNRCENYVLHTTQQTHNFR